MVIEAMVVATAVAGVVGLVRWARRPATRMLRALGRLPRHEIARVPAGVPVIIVGKLALAGEPLIAPLTRRRCACFTVVVEERVEDSWRIVLEETRASNFMVRDDTGKALVLMNQSLHERIVIDLDRHFGSASSREPNFKELLESRGQSTTGLFFDRTLRYSEGVLEERELVVVAAAGRWETDPRGDPGDGAGPYREAPRRLVLESTDALPVQVSDSGRLVEKAGHAPARRS